jgi:high affinity Mn2+ porin
LRADDAAEAFTPELWNIHFQMTLLPQYHPGFSALYSSHTTSLKNTDELNCSFTATWFLGLKAWEGGYLYANPECPAGSGFSMVTGLPDFPNGEISKVGTPNPTYNQARLYFQQVLGLGGEQEKIDDDQNQLACKEDISRITLTGGKFGLGDFFDNNAFAHDARTQFMNLAFVDNLPWDYAADTHGYTIGIVAELNQKDWAIRFAEAMVSTYANGPDYDANIPEARSDNAELEWRYGTDTTAGKLRFLVYANHAHMGRYQDALNASPVNPDVTSVRQYSEKFGLGLNWEQSLGANLGLYARVGWNDGQTETWEFTAVDQQSSIGLSAKGDAWGRAGDLAGLAAAISGLSAIHQQYLAAGGADFDIGDGALNYAPEEVVELYYLYKPISSIGLTLDLQGVNNPAYNQDRGPVGIIAGRAHIEI